MRARSGQTMVEYVFVFLALLAVFTAVGYLVTAARKSSAKTENLIKADYP